MNKIIPIFVFIIIGLFIISGCEQYVSRNVVKDSLSLARDRWEKYLLPYYVMDNITYTNAFYKAR